MGGADAAAGLGANVEGSDLLTARVGINAHCDNTKRDVTMQPGY